LAKDNATTGACWRKLRCGPRRLWQNGALDAQLERLAQLKAMLEHGAVNSTCAESAVQ
jgi:hypothetical protein